MSDYIRCKICSNNFNEPRSLQCGHSFCKSCLQALVDDENNLKCPLDMECFKVPEGRAENLMRNFALEEAISKADAKFPAEKCEEHHDETARYFCESCKKAFCESCLLFHERHAYCDWEKSYDKSKASISAIAERGRKALQRIEVQATAARSFVQNEHGKKKSFFDITLSKMNKAVENLQKATEVLSTMANEAVEIIANAIEADGLDLLQLRAKTVVDSAASLMKKDSLAERTSVAAALVKSLESIELDSENLCEAVSSVPQFLIDENLTLDMQAILSHATEIQEKASCQKYMFLNFENPLNRENERLGEEQTSLLSTNLERETSSPSTTPNATPERSNGDTRIILLGGSGDGKKAMMCNEAQDSWCALAPMSSQHFYAAATVWYGKVIVAGGDFPATKSVEMFDPQTNVWTEFPSLQVARSCHNLLNVNGCLYAIGGRKEKDILSSIERYDLKSRSWKQVNSLKLARFGLASASCQNRAIVTGGFSPEKEAVASCEICDFDKRQSSFSSPLNFRRAYHAAAADRNCVYVFGGRTVDYFCVDEVEQYNMVTKEWTVMQTGLTVPRFELAATNANGRIYLVGGCNVKDRTSLDVVECFDTDSGLIRRVKKLPEPNRALAAVSVAVFALENVKKQPTDPQEASNSADFDSAHESHAKTVEVINSTLSVMQSAKHLLLCVGGKSRNKGQNEVKVFDIITNRWNSVAPTIKSHYYTAAARYNGGVVVVGGGDEGSLGSVEYFDPKTNSWTMLPSLQVPRDNHAMVIAGSDLYVIGGCNGTECLRSVECYDAENKSWKSVAALNVARQRLAAAVCRNGIVVTGGVDANCALSSCEMYSFVKREWIPIAPLNIGRQFHTSEAYNDSIYVFGGSASRTSRAEIEQYDAVLNKWNLLETKLSVSRFEVAAACIDRQIYLVGGCSWSEKGNSRVELDTIDCFDPVRQLCRPVSKLPLELRAHAVACLSVAKSDYKSLLGSASGSKPTPKSQ